MLSAYFGQKIMDNFLITESEMKLRVQICVVESEDYVNKHNIFEKTDEEIYEKLLIPCHNEKIEEEEIVFFIFKAIIPFIL